MEVDNYKAYSVLLNRVKNDIRNNEILIVMNNKNCAKEFLGLLQQAGYASLYMYRKDYSSVIKRSKFNAKVCIVSKHVLNSCIDLTHFDIIFGYDLTADTKRAFAIAYREQLEMYRRAYYGVAQNSSIIVPKTVVAPPPVEKAPVKLEAEKLADEPLKITSEEHRQIAISLINNACDESSLSLHEIYILSLVAEYSTTFDKTNVLENGNKKVFYKLKAKKLVDGAHDNYSITRKGRLHAIALAKKLGHGCEEQALWIFSRIAFYSLTNRRAHAVTGIQQKMNFDLVKALGLIDGYYINSNITKKGIKRVAELCFEDVPYN